MTATAEAAAKPPRSSMFAALAEPTFRAYLVGMLFTFLPLQMRQVALGYLAYVITGSAIGLGLVQLAWGAPQVILTIFAGVIADRYDRRVLLTVTQGAIAVITAATAILIHLGIIELWHLIVTAALQGAVFSFNVPARQGMVPSVVSKENLANGVALNNSLVNLTRVLGPGVTGALIAVPLVGIGGVYDLMAIGSVIATILGWKLDTPSTASEGPKQPVLAALADGLRYIRRNQVLPTLILLAFVPILLGVPYQVLMPVFALNILDVGSPGLGALLMMAGIGALGGSLAVAAFSSYPRKAQVQLIALIFFGIFLVLFAVVPNYYFALLMMVAVGAAQNVYMSLNTTLMMMHTDRDYLGRAMGIYMLTWSLTPVTTLPITAAADAWGAQTVVAVLGIGVTVLSIVIHMANPKYRVAAETR